MQINRLMAATACIVIALSSCAKKHIPTETTATATPPTPSKPATAATAYSPEQLEKGHIIYNNKCGTCHNLKKPAAFTVKEWNNILPDMSDKARLGAEEAALVHAWVMANTKS